MRSRRDFLRTSLMAGLAWPVARVSRAAPSPAGLRPFFPDPQRHWRGESSVSAWLRTGGSLPVARGAPDQEQPPRRRPLLPAPTLAERFSDLRRHFVFEYYPWYGGPPRYFHWDQWDRVPPFDLASNYVPRLGAYDSRARAVLEQHARWIADSGAGAVALSWWGPDSYEDRTVPLVMDVMRDHDLKVTFHLESYVEDRGPRFASDVLYLLREYGERRRWDALLLLRDADGREGPVLKGFRMILPERVRDCHGVEHRVRDYTPDAEWRRQTDTLRDVLRRDFARLTLLADSLDFGRLPATGFDGIAIYDHFIPPEAYYPIGEAATQRGLLFSLNTNPGFDTIEPRHIEPGSCYGPTPFLPRVEALDWGRAEDRERAARLSEQRIAGTFAATVEAQTDRALANSRRGFFLVYLNSFNEWHEGHAFEPMKDAAALGEVERAFGYHNPQRGDYRLQALSALLQSVCERAPESPAAAGPPANSTQSHAA